MVNAWELIKIGDYQTACAAADSEFAESSSVLPLRNKVFALLCMERFDEAAELCRTIIHKTEGSTDSDFIFLGVCQWLRDERDAAIETWQSATKTKYTDAAGGVEVHLLLFYASVACNNNELRRASSTRLAALCKGSARKNWPGPIGAFLLGELGEDELMSMMSAQPVLRAKQFCQAAFYMAMMRELAGDMDGARRYLREACDQGSVTLTKQEYYLAKATVKMGSV